MSNLGRNLPCPCNSGQKYKRCCGAKHQQVGARLDPVDRWGWTEADLQLEIRRLEQYDPRNGIAPRFARWYPSRAARVSSLIEAVLPAERQSTPRKVNAVANRTHSSKRSGWTRPDVDDERIREVSRRVNRRVRDALREAPDEHGLMAGLLQVAGEYASEEYMESGLDPTGLAFWFYGVWGELVHRFDPSLSPSECLDGVPSYLAWRQPRTPA